MAEFALYAKRLPCSVCVFPDLENLGPHDVIDVVEGLPGKRHLKMAGDVIMAATHALFVSSYVDI